MATKVPKPQPSEPSRVLGGGGNLDWGDPCEEGAGLLELGDLSVDQGKNLISFHPVIVTCASDSGV